MDPVLDNGMLYAVIGAIVWGYFLFLNKHRFGHVPSTVFMMLTFASAASWYVLVSLVSGMSVTVPAKYSLPHWLFIFGTVTTLAAGLLILFHSIKIGQVSYVAPISKITPVFVLPFEVLFLNEQLTTFQMLGVGLATLAVYIANYRGGNPSTPILKATTYRPAQLALLSAFVLAILNVAQRVVLQELAFPTTTWVILKLGGTAIILSPLAIRDWRSEFYEDLPKLVSAGVILIIGEHFIALTFAKIPASIASPILSIQAIIAVLLGGIVLNEENLRIRLAAAVIAVLGVGLIAA
ncbi:DMT family transporter [Haladaptatus caseinilyticus]|uniref:DMT family transporter n=1 Tax=Haladaptatus caseinilyticus TaxID=2993314 RepID=UPI00224B0619|nr:DMT family transporter [Haladaptatus caseinilyticus]